MSIQPAGRPRLQFGERVMLAFVFVVAGGMAGIFGLFIETTLLVLGLSGFQVLFISNVLAGILGCSLYWRHRVHKQERADLLTDRAVKIGLMDEYVGNALREIAKHVRTLEPGARKDAIWQSIHKIKWAIVDALPKSWGIDDDISKSRLIDITEVPTGRQQGVAQERIAS